jgi:hypothetical protein
MRAFVWLFAAACGLGLMLLTYFAWVRPHTLSAWSHGVIIVGPHQPNDHSPSGDVIPALLRILPANEGTEAVLRALGVEVSDKNLSLQAQIRSKLLGLSLTEAGIGTDLLVSGRLPTAPDEILAGPDAPEQDRLKFADRMLTVVGRLKLDATLFTQSYLVPLSASTNNLFPDNNSSVHPARLLRLTQETMQDRRRLQQLLADYPSPKYTRVMPIARLARGTYYLYLIGEAIFFFGGAMP